MCIYIYIHIIIHIIIIIIRRQGDVCFASFVCRVFVREKSIDTGTAKETMSVRQ